MGLLKKIGAALRREKLPRRTAAVRVETLVAQHAQSVGFEPLPPTRLLSPVCLSRSLFEEQATVGMQGYAPIVSQTRARRYCIPGCGERVFKGKRHICLHNAHHYVDTLTTAERAHVLAQLRDPKYAKKVTKLPASYLKLFKGEAPMTEQPTVQAVTAARKKKATAAVKRAAAKRRKRRPA